MPPSHTQSLIAAAKGCGAVLHTASPFFNSSTEAEALLRPAVEGTLSVLEACEAAGITDVVVTSSTATVFAKTVTPEHVFTEDDHSDEAMLRANNVLYPLSKVLAENAAVEFAASRPKMRLVIVSWEESGGKIGGFSFSASCLQLNPTLVIGPMLQSRMNTSSQTILDFFDGKRRLVPKGFITMVDVRDVALAHVRALERPQARGRYLLIGAAEKWSELMPALQEAAGQYAKVRKGT